MEFIKNLQGRHYQTFKSDKGKAYLSDKRTIAQLLGDVDLSQPQVRTPAKKTLTVAPTRFLRYGAQIQVQRIKRDEFDILLLPDEQYNAIPKPPACLGQVCLSA